MNKAIILHGTGCSSELYWYPFIKRNLEEREYDVWVPNLPNSDKANLSE